MDETACVVHQLIRQYLSSEQVSGYLSKHHGISLSHEMIYRYIYRAAIRHARLKQFLRQGGKQTKKRYRSGARASCIPNRASITEWPQEMQKKARLIDWKCGTVIGQDRKGVLVTVMDRASLYTCSSRVLSRSVHVVNQAIIRMMRPFKKRVQTLTFDNGSELVKHETIARALEAHTYLAHPYSLWERGINENSNDLNNRPRKNTRILHLPANDFPSSSFR